MIVTRFEPIPTPFPDVSGHLGETKTVDPIGAGGSGSIVAIGFGVGFGKITLPNIHAVFPVRFEVITPRETVTELDAAASRVFPLGFGGEALAGPRGVGHRIMPGDVHHGMIFSACER